MPKLVAAAYEDGWAFVEDGGELRSIKPPYYRRHALPVSGAALDAAVHHYGFELVGKDFDDWQTLIAFLEREMVRIRKSSGQDPPADFSRLLRFAPEDVLRRYLDRIEFELFANSEWNAALGILSAMLESNTILNHPELFGRAARLLKRCYEARSYGEDQLRRLVQRDNLNQRFPNAVEVYGASDIYECARGVSQRKTVFALSA